MIGGHRGARPHQRVVKPGTIDLVGHDGTSVPLTDPCSVTAAEASFDLSLRATSGTFESPVRPGTPSTRPLPSSS